MQTRGKELALIFFNQCALSFTMGTGSAFYVGKSSEKDKSPLDYRTNLALICSNDMTIYVVDCHNTQNQVRLCWRDKTDPIWSDYRGPDLLDSEETKLIENIQYHINNNSFTEYFNVSKLRIRLNYNIFFSEQR